MKIGILTLPFNNNYGGFLQAYALQYTLKSCGHNVIIINRRPNKLTLLDNIKLFTRNTIRSIIYWKKYPITNVYGFKGRLMHNFVSKRMQLSEPIYNSNELISYCTNQNFDAIFVGSDQVWRPEYGPNIEDYFLVNINDHTLKFAYAASFGIANPKYSKEEIYICGSSLNKFKFIGVREVSALKIFRDFGWPLNNVNVVVDPTMLISREHYIKIANEYTNVEKYKNKVLAYILDINSEIKYLIKKTEQQLGLESIFIINPTKWKFEDYVFPSIEEWLSAFQNADFIVTDSFHGAVFSIILHKNFIVYSNKDRGRDRIETLMNTFGFTDRIIDDSFSFDLNKYQEIDWSYVDSILLNNYQYFKDNIVPIISKNSNSII